jgi:hypothetical protein
MQNRLLAFPTREISPASNFPHPSEIWNLLPPLFLPFPFFDAHGSRYPCVYRTCRRYPDEFRVCEGSSRKRRFRFSAQFSKHGRTDGPRITAIVARQCLRTSSSPCARRVLGRGLCYVYITYPLCTHPRGHTPRIISHNIRAWCAYDRVYRVSRG